MVIKVKLKYIVYLKFFVAYLSICLGGAGLTSIVLSDVAVVNYGAIILAYLTGIVCLLIMMLDSLEKSGPIPEETYTFGKRKVIPKAIVKSE